MYFDQAFEYILLWNNGVFRSGIRAVFNLNYPDEIKKIESRYVDFELTNKPPSRLSLGIRYPKDIIPKEINSFKIDGNIKINFIDDNNVIKTINIYKIDRIWSDFNNSGYQVSEFYTFVCSKNLVTTKNMKINIDLDNKFKNYDIILYEASLD